MLILSSLLCAAAVAQVTPNVIIERFGGKTRLGSQPPVPVHIELRRAAGTVSGTISIPGGSFDLVDLKDGNPMTGRFRGEGGEGPISLRLNGDNLTGVFSLDGQPGTFTAQRTMQDAASFFRPPVQRLDLTTAQWLADLDSLVRILTREHASPFHRITKENFTREVARARAAIPQLDGAAVALEFRKLGAMIGDGHTSVDFPQNTQLPITLYWFGDGLRLVNTSEVNKSLLGAKLISIDNRPIIELSRRARKYVAQGEAAGFYLASLPDLLKDTNVLRALGIDVRKPMVFMFKTAEGARRPIELSATKVSTELAAATNDAPLWQRRIGLPFWSEALPDGSVYVNWRSYDELESRGADLLKNLDAAHPRRLIIDLRDNSGGDFTIGRAFIRTIARRAWLNRHGVLFVMIGRKTFSAAMTNAVDFKRMTNAILVGEAAGAAPNNWQEVRGFYLPNSGLRVDVSTRYYEFLPGSAELRPDLRAPPKPSDWTDSLDAGVRLVLDTPKSIVGNPLRDPR